MSKKLIIKIKKNIPLIDQHDQYGFWGGNAEESDIIRKVFNNEFEELPKSLYNQIMTSGKNNLRGNIIKILLLNIMNILVNIIRK